MEQMQPQGLSDNPLLQAPKPFDDGSAEHRKALEEKSKEFQRLCYSTFHNYADGQKLWEMLKEMYLMQQHVDPAAPNANNLAIWWDGFKSSLLGLYNMGLAHKKRINEVNV